MNLFSTIRALLALLLLLSALTHVSVARPAYVNRVPTPYSCETCHLDPMNRNLRTGFGIDFALSRGTWAAQDADNPGICVLDSDGDGLSNGQELADPDCVWRPGSRLPAGPTTNPAEPRDPDRCGDGILHIGEECDGEELPETTCLSMGFMGGQLTCRPDCTLDDTACIPFPLPDAAIEPDEGRIADMGVAMDADIPQDQGRALDVQLAFDASHTTDTHTSDIAVSGDTMVTSTDQSLPVADGRSGTVANGALVESRRGGCVAGADPHTSKVPLGLFIILICWRWDRSRPRVRSHRSRLALRP